MTKKIIQILVTIGFFYTSAQAYIIQSGDTLYGIAKRAGISVSELQLLNSLEHIDLKVGQHLILPKEVMPSVVPPTTLSIPLPTVVTGKVSFYAAIYDPKTLTATRTYALGPVNTVMPLASTYKTAVLWATLREVDAGTLQLSMPITTTEANRSIEDYSPGTNSLLTLAQRSIEKSENTAADILHRLVGTERIAKLVWSRSPCTNILLPTKTFWAAQAGLLPTLIPATNQSVLLNAALKYQKLLPSQRLAFASRLNTESLKINADVLLKQLDRYFLGPNYHPSLDTAFQNTSTAKGFTDLLASLYLRPELSTQSQQVMRNIMARGCCVPKKAPFRYTYWGAKAGSGWRLLTLTGYVELPDGRVMAYIYLNHESNTRSAERIEAQIRPVVNWIGIVLAKLAK
jgi:beta-lactamase class A